MCRGTVINVGHGQTSLAEFGNIIVSNGENSYLCMPTLFKFQNTDDHYFVWIGDSVATQKSLIKTIMEHLEKTQINSWSSSTPPHHLPYKT